MLFALPFGVGTLLCQYLLPDELRPWAAGAVLLAGLASSFFLDGRRKKGARIAAVGLSVGILWFSGYAALYLAPAEELAGTTGTVTLELLDYPEEASHGSKCAVRLLDSPLRGKALYYGDYSLLGLEPGTHVTTEAKYYSAVTLGGSESEYYTSQGIFLRLYGKGDAAVSAGNAGSVRYLPQRLARGLKAAVAELYGEPSAGFITALLTGERDGLDVQSSTDLSESGLSHIVAVSGLHCGFLIGLLGILVFRRQKLTALLGYPVLLMYMVMVGCTPSVVRSCVMIGFTLMAPLVDREGDSATSLAGALMAILLVNPFAVASVSLQLSFAAVAGLLLLTPVILPVLDSYCPGKQGKVRGFLVGTAAASLGVMVLTAPLCAVYFGSLALVSPLSNIAVLWMAPVLFAAALTVSVLYILWPGFAPLAVVPDLLARYVLGAAGLMAKLPWHGVRFTGPGIVLWLLLVYAMLLLCALSKDRRRKYLFAAVLSLVCLVAAKAVPALSVRSSDLIVVAVDVGQGAGTLLHADGVTALVDCGSLGSSRGPGDAVADAMDAYGWEEIDFMALTHYHEDHAGGLEELSAQVDIGELLLPQLLGSEDQAGLQQDVLALAERYGVAVSYVEQPEEVPLGSGGACLTVYPPLSEGGTNEEGLTVLCSAGEFDILITGDMSSGTEKKLVETYAMPDIEVLVAGHHGSKNSTSEALLEAVTPEVGIVSVGAGNTFGHPAEEALGRMRSAGMEIYRTDLQGNILIRVHQQSGG